jgi:transcription elongation factor Elf1
MNEQNKKTKYTKKFHCFNCGEDFVKTFEFGEVAEKGSCPYCGVSDAQLERKDLSKFSEGLSL